MKECIKKSGSRTTMGAVLLVAVIGVAKMGHMRKLQREIDEFDLIMRELKEDRMRHCRYYE